MTNKRIDLLRILPKKSENAIILTDDTPRNAVHCVDWHNATCIMCDMIKLLTQKGIRNFIYRGIHYADQRLIDQLLCFRKFNPDFDITIWVCGYNKTDTRRKYYSRNAKEADRSFLMYPEMDVDYCIEEYCNAIVGKCDWAISLVHSSNTIDRLPRICEGHQTKLYNIVIDERMKASIHRFYETCELVNA